MAEQCETADYNVINENVLHPIQKAIDNVKHSYNGKFTIEPVSNSEHMKKSSEAH